MKNKSSLLLTVGMFLMISSSVALNTFKYFPDYQSFTGWLSPTVLKIFSQQDNIIVGYSDGSLRLYSLSGVFKSNWYGHNSSIIDIEWIPKYGPITLDSSGKAIRWSEQGDRQMVWNMNSSLVTDMAVTSSGEQYYVAFSSGSVVYEYSALQLSYNLTQTYRINDTFLNRIIYSKNHQYLYATTTNYYVVGFNCNTGIKSSGNISTSPSTVKDMKLMSKSQIVSMITTSRDIYTFQSKLNFPGSFTIPYSPSIFTVCPSTDFRITAQPGSQKVSVFDYRFERQELTYFTSQVKAMDCSQKYLVTYDSNGYLTINTYGSPIPPNAIPYKLTMEFIVGIAIGAIVLLLLIVLMIVICVKKKRTKRLMIQGNYQRAPVFRSKPYFKKKGLKINFRIDCNEGYIPPTLNQQHANNQQYSSSQKYIAHQTQSQAINTYGPLKPPHQVPQRAQKSNDNPSPANQPGK